MEINDKIKTIVEKRRKKDSELFFIDTIVVSSEFSIEKIKRKNFFGISFKGEVILQPIFDAIDIITDSLVAAKINNRFSFYNICSRTSVTEYHYTHYDCIGNYFRLYKPIGIYDIFDVSNGRMLNNRGNYEEYNLKYDNTEYCWVKRGDFFDYIKRQSGEVICLPGVTMAYDTEFGMFGKNKFETVKFFEETGVENKFKLRELVSKAGGYLTLKNYTYNIEDVIDVYGNIINI